MEFKLWTQKNKIHVGTWLDNFLHPCTLGSSALPPHWLRSPCQANRERALSVCEGEQSLCLSLWGVCWWRRQAITIAKVLRAGHTPGDVSRGDFRQHTAHRPFIMQFLGVKAYKFPLVKYYWPFFAGCKYWIFEVQDMANWGEDTER